MKRLVGLTSLALVVASTGGCGWLWGKDGYFRDRGNDYLNARQTAPMQVPPGVELRPVDPLLPLPQRVADSQADADYEVPRPPKLQTTAVNSDFSVQDSPEQRWLLARRPAAQLWAPTRQFLVDSGFEIAEERPQTGELVTGWQSASRLAPSLRQAAGQDGEARLRIRIEPGVQRNASEIHVLSSRRSAGSQVDTPWPERPANTTLDIALLDELQSSLARNAELGDSVSLLAKRDYEAPQRVALAQDASGNPLLRLDSDLDRAWASVGRALEVADIRVEDLNRSLGIYYINLSERAESNTRKPGFLSRLFGRGADRDAVEARAERYQLRLTEVGSSVQVAVEQDLDTLAPGDVARRVLTRLQEGFETR